MNVKLKTKFFSNICKITNSNMKLSTLILLGILIAVFSTAIEHYTGKIWSYVIQAILTVPLVIYWRVNRDK